MANGDIRQKIVLEGEKEYNAALKEAQRSLKVLRSELKAETAELGKNASEQQKNEVRTRNLQKQIKEQEKVVRTYEKALKEVREKYGDNEEAVAKWEVKLNDARTSLYNLKNSLDDTATSMTKVGSAAKSSGDMGIVAMNSLAESLERVGSVGDSISGTLESAFTGIVGTIKDVVTEVWTSVVDLAARSNNLVDLAGFWNTDVTTIQKYKGAVAEASGSLEDLNSVVTKINAGDAKKIAELTGVSGENYSDQWQYAMAVMDAMHQMTIEQRNAAGFEIFGGRQATKAFDLLNDWGTVLDHLDKYDVEKGGYGLTKEQLQNMSDLYDKVNGLKESWQSLKDMATVELFGDLALNITGNLQNIVDAFKEYFDAEDDAGREAALQKVRENIEKMFEAIKEAIEKGIEMLGDLADELQKSEDPAVRAFGSFLEKIVNVLEWFSDESNWKTVERGFEALIGVWAIGKIGKALSNISAFAADVKTILGGGSKLFSLSGGNSGGSGGTGGTSGTGGTGGTAAGGGFFAKAAGAIKSGFAANGLWGLTPAAVVAAAVTPALIAQNDAIENMREEQAQMEEAAAKLEAENSENARFVRTTAANSFLVKDANGNELKNVLGQSYSQLTDETFESLMGLKDRSGAEMAKLRWALMGVVNPMTGNYAWNDLESLWNGELEANDAPELAAAIAKALSETDIGKMWGWQRGSGVVNGREAPAGWVWNNGVYQRVDDEGNLMWGKSAYFKDSAYMDERLLNEWIAQQNALWSETHGGISADSWNGTGGGINAEISEASANLIGTSVKGAVSGIQVLMDGTVVGHLVAPTVSQDIAREAALP